MAPAASIITKFEEATRSIPRNGVAPINRAALDADRTLVLSKASSLRSYSRYLAQARAVKAQRGGVSQAFERAVQCEARRALDDMDAFGGATLRVMQQVNQTALWRQTLDRMVAGLSATGALSAKQIWEDLEAHADYRALMREQGLTDEMASAMTEALVATNARLVLRTGKPAVEVHPPGQDRPRVLSLGDPPTRPATITDLLRRSRFDQIVAAFSNREPVYLEVVASPHEFNYTLADLVAISAVAGRERVAEHVRKLEDTGLAIYSGRDPFTLIVTLAVIGGILMTLAMVFHGLCGPEITDDAGEPIGQNETVCNIATVLTLLAVIVLAGLAGILLAAGFVFAGIVLAVWVYGMAIALEMMERLFPVEKPG